MRADRWTRAFGIFFFAFVFATQAMAGCPAGSVQSSGYCWVVNMGEPSATATCARVGLTGSNGFVTGLKWTPAILADVSSKLGCTDAGDTGCCAQSMWRTTATNTCFTDNFSADVGGADFFNWSGQRLPGQFAVDACDCPSGTCNTPIVCDANDDGKIDRNDIALITAARGMAVSPGDPRDADGDGTITVADARKCALMCTKANCAP
jgi:hypothetical protein